MRVNSLFLILLFVVGANAQDRSIDSLKRRLPGADQKDLLKTLIELSWEYRFVNADTARKYGLKALSLAQSMELPRQEAAALNNIGITHEAQGNYNEALTYELQALAIRKRMGDSASVAQTLNDIGIIYDEKGDYQKSLEYYFQARRIFEQGNDLFKIAMVISNIGIVLKEQKEYQKVVNSYYEALGIYKKIKNKFGIAACDANLGSVYLVMNRNDSALHYSLKSAQEFEALNNRQFLAASLTNAGMAYHKLGKVKEAIKLLMQSKSLNEEYDNKRELADLLIYLARMERETGDFRKGIELASQALVLSKKIGAKKVAMDSHKELALLWADAGNFEQAFRQYQFFDLVKDSLFETEKSKQISELQTRYETEKKEAKINLLVKDNELKDINIRENSYKIIGLLLLVIVLVAFGLLWQNRVKLKQQAALNSARAELRQLQLQAVIASQEEERKRFAADLHDGFGQMISALRLGLSRETPDGPAIQYALGLLNEMNVEIRNIAFNLMPQVLMKEGLEEALREFASRLTQSGGVTIDVQTYNLSPDIDAEKRIALYRICQEWTNNVIKYSGCRTIVIQAVQHPEELVITIEDDGSGFDKDRLITGAGNGWKNINSRLSLIGGSIDIDSQPGRKGTIAIIAVPVKPA
ncbi:MAG: tetratricopeptide repeat protein [Bacteroidetes bacterium]|nr:tetratricopeptide repeat protein [Bacteroidota bacterium]